MKYTSAENLAYLSKKSESISHSAKMGKKEATQSTKLIKRGARQKLNEIEKKNILGSIGIERPKQLKKYLK